MEIKYLRELHFLNAALFFNVDITKDTKDLVNVMLNDGIYLDCFMDIIDARNVSYIHFLSQFNEIIDHFEVKIASENEAGWIIIAYYAHKIAEKDCQNIFELADSFVSVIRYGWGGIDPDLYCAVDFILLCYNTNDDETNYPFFGFTFPKSEAPSKIREEALTWLMKNKNQIPHSYLYIS
jgi:hypothetical protein